MDEKSLIFFDFIFFTNIIVVENLLIYYHYKIMNRKKIIVRLALIFSILSWIMVSLPSQAVNLILNLDKGEQTFINFDLIRPIHFKEYKNDFGWLFYFLSNTNADEDEIKINGTTTCLDKKRWFYYNAERWERLRPLDEGTLSERDLQDSWLGMTWWIYTHCTAELEKYQNKMKCCGLIVWTPEYDDNGCVEYADLANLDTEECTQLVKEENLDIFSYYGAITHTYSWQDFLLAVWVSYATWTPWINVNGNLWKTFQIHPDAYAWQLPFGLIYDINWWVGFAWCEVQDPEGLNDIIEGLNSGDPDKDEITEFFVITGSEGEEPYLRYIDDQDTDFFGTNKFNCKDMWRDMTPSLKILVEWLIWMWDTTYKNLDRSVEKSQYFASVNINNATLINYARQKAEILCRWKWTNDISNIKNNNINCINDVSLVDLGNDSDYKNRTIIVKKGNVKLKPFTANTNDYYDIFIDNWNLIIDETNAKKFVIDINGFPNDSKTTGEFQDEVNTIITTTETIGSDIFSGLQSGVWIASILKGNFIVNWHIEPVSENTWLDNRYFIYWKLTSLDDNNALVSTFKWSCNGNLWWSDGTFCPWPIIKGKNIPYQNVPLAIIDQNYDSPLLK